MDSRDVAVEAVEARVQLRNEPVQARSTARLTALLDAAASVVDEIGYERLTTAMVADRAGASIGTVYRYFPDRIAVLQALSARNLERVTGRVSEEILDPRHPGPVAALGAALDSFVETFRVEPGFRGLRVGDAIDLGPSSSDRTFNSIVAARMLEDLVRRFEIKSTSDLEFRFEVAIVVADSLAARAFAQEVDGDDAFISAGRDVVNSMLSEHLAA